MYLHTVVINKKFQIFLPLPLFLETEIEFSNKKDGLTVVVSQRM
jgi:hypothetical protein